MKTVKLYRGMVDGKVVLISVLPNDELMLSFGEVGELFHGRPLRLTPTFKEVGDDWGNYDKQRA
jgi:hypothetical protein